MTGSTMSTRGCIGCWTPWHDCRGFRRFTAPVGAMLSLRASVGYRGVVPNLIGMHR
jgi:hypothetical protein